MARDRIGIIHDITRTIADMKGNLTDIRQQVLQGYFSMILYGSFPDTVSPETIRGQLLAVDKTNPFEISIKPVTEAMPPLPLPLTPTCLRQGEPIGLVLLLWSAGSARNTISTFWTCRPQVRARPTP